MDSASDDRPITRINKLYLHPPFLKQLEKRGRETRLIESLEECICKLQRDPRQRGLKLKFIERCGGKRILSARINEGDRLILAELHPGEAGLLYFDNHDPAYNWVRDNRNRIIGMLQKVGEYPRGGSLRTPMPFPRTDEDAPIAVPDFGAIRLISPRSPSPIARA
jgi:hypothetical protein